jgi:hypothetical protein
MGGDIGQEKPLVVVSAYPGLLRRQGFVNGMTNTTCLPTRSLGINCHSCKPSVVTACRVRAFGLARVS